MSNNPHECSEEVLLSMLSDDDTDLNHEQLFCILENCTRCQQRFEELAAEDHYWERAHRILLGHDSSGSLRSSERSTVSISEPQSASRASRRDHDWAESMAKQLLGPASHPEMLGRIGRYEVERLIGSGGMGIVFKALDTELNRQVAIKVLAPYLAGNGAARQRFAREAKAAAAVVHEHVVPIYNVETDGDSPFLVMQYIGGESLQSRIDREGALELCEILRIGMQVASGLDAAHAQGLVHRDIKPSNIMLEPGVERSVITDFGLARTADDASLTNTGFHAGTPPYMSPEQARGDSVDWRSDLFSLGSVMYAMCTGRPPFRAETAYGVLRKITDTEPRSIRELNPFVPEWLEFIVMELMSKDMLLRWQSASEISTLLEECLAHTQRPMTHPLPNVIPKKLKQKSLSDRVTHPFSNLPTLGKWTLAVTLMIGIFAVWNWFSSGKEQVREQHSFVASSSTLGLDGTVESQRKSATNVANQMSIGRQHPVAPDPADKIRQRLSKRVEFTSEGLSLEQVLASIEELIQTPIDVRRESLEELDVDAMKTIAMRTSGTAREHFRQLGSQLQLGYIVHEGNIEIASNDYVRRNPVLRLYDLSHVMSDSRNIEGLIVALQSLVAPNEWTENGGYSSSSVVDSVLIVRATESMHTEIEQLLSQLVNVSSISK